VVEEAGRHLGPAGVVDADEEDLGHIGHESSLDLGEGAEALAGEPLGEQGQEGGDLGRLGQLGERLVDEALDGLDREDAGEVT